MLNTRYASLSQCTSFYDGICSIVPCDWNAGWDESLPTLYLVCSGSQSRTSAFSRLMRIGRKRRFLLPVMGQKIQLVGSACKGTLPRSIRRKVVIRYFASILLAAEKRFDFFHVLGIARGHHLAHLDNPMPHHAAIDVFVIELSQIIREPLVIPCEDRRQADDFLITSRARSKMKFFLLSK